MMDGLIKVEKGGWPYWVHPIELDAWLKDGAKEVKKGAKVLKPGKPPKTADKGKTKKVN